MGVVQHLKLKDLVTLLGTSCGVTSIILSLDGRFLWIAGSFIYFALIFDLLDGFIAKLMNQSNELGTQLDSLNDVICFGVAPAILMYQAYTKVEIFLPFVLLIFCITYIIGAVLRLAWFNINKDTGYEGVTTPVTTSILLSMFFIDTFYATFPSSGPVLGKVLNYTIPISMIVLPYLNISRFLVYGEGVRTRENKKLVIFLVIIMGFGLASSVLVFFSHSVIGPYVYILCVAILVMLLFYLGIGVYNYFQRKNKSLKK